MAIMPDTPKISTLKEAKALGCMIQRLYLDTTPDKKGRHIPMAQEQKQINGVDMEAYEDFKKRHATRTPTEFAKVMHRADPEHGFELEWWSDDPDIVEWFSIAIIKKFGWLKGSGKMQINIPYWNMPALRIERDGNTGMQVRAANFEVHAVCSDIFLRILREKQLKGNTSMADG